MPLRERLAVKIPVKLAGTSKGHGQAPTPSRPRGVSAWPHQAAATKTHLRLLTLTWATIPTKVQAKLQELVNNDQRSQAWVFGLCAHSHAAWPAYTVWQAVH